MMVFTFAAFDKFTWVNLNWFRQKVGKMELEAPCR